MAGEREFAAALEAMVSRVRIAAQGLAVEAAHRIQAGAQRRTPVQSGTLRRSEHVGDIHYGAGVYSAHVGPSVVYARRVELGFQGADSLGRVYQQHPRPYLKPAVQDERPRVPLLIRAGVVRAIKG